MKIVINTCYGGFGLSLKGQQRYLELMGQTAYFYQPKAFGGETKFQRIDNIDDASSIFVYCTTHDQGKIIDDYPEDIFYFHELKRSDPHLVQVVEELGAESFAEWAILKIVDIEKGRWFKIDEYDGYESIQYRDIDDEWILAE